MAKHEPYPSEVTDVEWQIIRRLLPERERLGRPPKYHPREMINAIFYITRSGCPWRMMPREYPHWRLVYYYFAKWHRLGVWAKLNDALRDRIRTARLKKAPTAAILDSQSVRMAGQRGECGYDAGKKIMGRKRHLVVDAPGLILAVVVHPADIQDRDGARLLVEKLRWFGWLQVVWADGGYAGKLVAWFNELALGRAARLEIVNRKSRKFEILPKRWIVERTFAWLSRYRRLARDYEVKTDHSEAFTMVAACAIMTRRLAKYRSI